MNISGREVFGGSAYSVPYEIWISNDPERVVYKVVHDPREDKYLVLNEWVDSWEEVEDRMTKDRYGE